MSVCLRRREFIAALGGAAAWPLAARAQQGERMRRIGVLMSYEERNPVAQALLAAFLEALAKLGWSEGPTSDLIIAGPRLRCSSIKVPRSLSRCSQT